MFLSDKNVQDCICYKHGLITAEQLADLCNWPDVEYIRRWAATAMFTARHYEAFAAMQKEHRSVDTGEAQAQTYTDDTQAAYDVPPVRRRPLSSY